MIKIDIRALGVPGALFDGEGVSGGALILGRWLCLAATPSFALMAVLTGLSRNPMDMICPPGSGSALRGMSGMVAMYALMSVFHSPPWFKLMFGRRGGVAGSERGASYERVYGN